MTEAKREMPLGKGMGKKIRRFGLNVLSSFVGIYDSKQAT